MSTDDERRQKRKEVRFLQSESVWLQKALFALRKAEDARDKLADSRDEEPNLFVFSVDDREVRVEALEEAIEARVELLLHTVREARRTLF